MTGKADLPPHLGGDAPVQVELAGATGGDRWGWWGGRCAVRLRLAAGMIPSQE